MNKEAYAKGFKEELGRIPYYPDQPITMYPGIVTVKEQRRRWPIILGALLGAGALAGAGIFGHKLLKEVRAWRKLPMVKNIGTLSGTVKKEGLGGLLGGTETGPIKSTWFNRRISKLLGVKVPI